MVVCKMIDIVTCECIKGIRIIKIYRQELVSKNGEEMHSMQNRIKMNNRTQVGPLLDIWMNLPHPCLTIT